MYQGTALAVPPAAFYNEGFSPCDHMFIPAAKAAFIRGDIGTPEGRALIRITHICCADVGYQYQAPSDRANLVGHSSSAPAAWV